MSVVARMNMPKGCGSCPIANFGYCSIDHKQVSDPLMGYPENRPANCHIICSLPEGHGRLVDADAVESIIRKWFEEIKLNPDILLDGVKSLPAIVPAERSET